MTDSDRDWVSVGEAAKIAEVQQSTVRGWYERYKLGTKVGGRLRIKKDDLDKFIAGDWEKVERKPRKKKDM